MFLRLLKLIIKTRFSWSYFLVVGLLLIYSVFAVLLSRLPTGNEFGDYYFAGLLALFTTVSVLTGGLSMTNSDSEFLLPSAVNRRSLSGVLYIGQYLYTGPIIFAGFLIYTMTSPYSMFDKVLMLIDIALLSTLPVSLSMAASNLKIAVRAGLAILFDVWVFSFKLGFPASPVSILTGHIYPSVAASIAVSAALLGIAFYLLSSEKLSFRVVDRRFGNSEYRKIKEYYGLTPFRAVFRYSFSRFELATRTNFSGTPTLSGRRINSQIVLIVFIIAAVLYAYAAIRFNPVQPGPFQANIVLIFSAVYVGAFPPILLSASAFPMERAWLSFTSMRASKYVPMLVVSKMIQLVMFMAPFAIADLILYLYGITEALSSIVLFLVIDPLFLGFFMAINFRFQSMQIKEENLITSRYTAAQFVLLPFLFALFGVAGVSAVFPIADVVFVPAIAAITALFLSWKGFWDRRVFTLVEKGFI